MVMWEGGNLLVVNASPAANRTIKRTESHAQHAIPVTLSLGGNFQLDTDGSKIRGEAIAVAPDVAHVCEAEGLIALLLVEPESRIGRAISATLLDGRSLAVVTPWPPMDFGTPIVANFVSPGRNDRTLIEVGRGLTAQLAGGAQAREPDAMVREMIAWFVAAGRQYSENISDTRLLAFCNKITRPHVHRRSPFCRAAPALHPGRSSGLS